ncbi:hypothetical protein F5B19DRAFT_494478 [Rostrohypoxylon terebratum]|nr:hypothetical protein F5B19DRAFT_494478 [Rostrohypoxylon terebratum]
MELAYLLRNRSILNLPPHPPVMCFYYPTPKPKKSKKSKRPSPTHSTTSIENTQDIPSMLPTGMNHPYGVYIPYGAGQRFDEYEPSYIAKAQAQWASQGETLKGTLGAVVQNGGKVDEVKACVSDGFADARNSFKDIHNAIRGTHIAVNDAYTAVGDAHHTIKEAYDAIQKNHSEYSAKQDGCVAEIRQVRTLLEDEVKKREEARRKRESMQEAWEHFQKFQQTERDAEPKSSRSSTRTQSSSSSSSSHKSGSNTRRRRRAPPEDQYESEKRHPQDREFRKVFFECMDEFFGDGNPHASRSEKHHENHNHFYTYPPTPPAWSGQYPPDPWNGRQHAPPPYPGWEGFYDDNIDGDMSQPRAPRRPYNAPRGGRALMEEHEELEHEVGIFTCHSMVHHFTMVAQGVQSFQLSKSRIFLILLRVMPWHGKRRFSCTDLLHRGVRGEKTGALLSSRDNEASGEGSFQLL